MQFSVGDKVVHPHRGPGLIVEMERKEFIDEARRYYVIDIAPFGLILHVPVRKASELGLRLAMSRTQIARMLDILRGMPGHLPEDHKARQEEIWEKMRTAHPTPVAEAVRDLAWRRHSAHLTKRDSELLKHGQEFLAAEVALVSDTQVSEAQEQIESALADSMANGT